MIQKVTIDAKPPYTKIFVDGKEINGVRKFSISQEVGMEIPVLKLDISAMEIEFVGTAVSEIEKSAP